MKSIGTRIKELRFQYGLTQKELAQKIHVTSTAISQWEREETEPKMKHIAKIAKFFDVSVDWLTGAILPPKTTLEDTITSCILVAFYPNVSVAGGTGSISLAEDESYTPIPAHVLKYKNIDNIACVTVTGDSMEPVLCDGSIIAVDRGDRRIRDGKLYVIRHNGLLRVKCLYQTPESLIVQSYNAVYPDEKYDVDILFSSDFEIIGRVFWISSEV